MRSRLRLWRDSYRIAGRDRQELLARVNASVDALELPDPVFKTSPWQPRELLEEGLRQWLRCCGVAIADGQVIGMPSRAVDEAWHGLILCTSTYARFCEDAYGTFLHHYPEGADSQGSSAAGTMQQQLGRTVVAWNLVARPGEEALLWDLDSRVGVEQPWGIPPERVTAIEAELGASERGLER